MKMSKSKFAKIVHSVNNLIAISLMILQIENTFKEEIFEV